MYLPFSTLLPFLQHKCPWCDSRKYPYPHHGRSLEIPRERGGLKGSNFREVGGFHGKLLFQRVTNHVQNIESNIQSI